MCKEAITLLLPLDVYSVVAKYYTDCFISNYILILHNSPSGIVQRSLLQPPKVHIIVTF